ncbi:outer membrane protein assembly factor BamA [Candidatus Pantoea edessiphila]|nr:outer membrane protein assembly factor BamA [Candidatus Pantoea edessiphila]
MIIKKLLFSLLFLIAIDVYANDKIKNINFEGLKRIPLNLISSKIPLKSGDVVDKIAIKNIIKFLYSTNNFEQVKVIKNNDTLTIKVKELPIISKVTIIGNKIINKEKIEKIFEDANIIAGNVINRNSIFLTSKSLEEFYSNIGKYNFTIKTIITPIPNNYSNIIFILKEGEFSKIDQINILGNKKFTYSKLLSLFDIRDKKKWWNILKSRIYQKQKLDNAVINLRKFYLKNGYIRFKVKSAKLSLTPNKKRVYITVYLNEGDQYKVLDIKLSSNLNNKLEHLKNLIKITKDDIYSVEKVHQATNRIKQAIIDYGYAYPIIHVNYKIDDVNKQVTICFNVNSGNRYYVRKIHFKGNDISKDIVLRRKIEQMEGAWLNDNLVNKSTRILMNTNYFDQVKVEKNFLPNSPNQIDLTYKVTEHKTGGIKFGLGYGKNNSLNFQSSISQNNLFGTGNIFTINVFKEHGHKKADIVLIDPYFSVEGISLSKHVFYNRMISDNGPNGYSNLGYNNISYGGDFSLGFPMSNTSTLNLGMGYTKNNIFNISKQISIYRYFQSIKNNDFFDNDFKLLTNDFDFNFGWTYNSLSQPFLPITGNFTNLNSKIAFLKSSNNFFKILLESSKYVPIDEDNKWILSGSVRLGFGAGFSGFGKELGKREMPFYENFYSGGPQSIRGFQTNTVGPKSVYLKKSNSLSPNCISTGECTISDNTIGGDALFSGSIELIFPIPLLNEKLSNSIRTSLFCDFGNVWDTRWDTMYKGEKIKNMPNYNDPKKIRISTGIAFKWLSPFGPLEFSYAIPIKQYQGDNIEKFQLYVGKTW